jgi:transmembrane sensor
MNKNYRDMKNKQDQSDLSEGLFSGADIPWEKSKAEIWNDLENRLVKEDSSPVSVRLMLPRKQWLAMAASLVLLLAVSSFMRFYSVKTYCPAGVHTSLNLPDGSVVKVNAATTVEYHPYWWFVSRKVKLEGEAFFSVEEGRKFQVVSDPGTTEVLGTTFNVFARGENYLVSCHTGSVRVSAARSEQSVLLSPNELAELNELGDLRVSPLDDQGLTPGWTKNLIMFTSTPLSLVFEEIERQYGIVIEAPAKMKQVYSGNFSLDQSVENILSLLCLPFDLTYERQTGNVYLVYPSEE